MVVVAVDKGSECKYTSAAVLVHRVSVDVIIILQRRASGMVDQSRLVKEKNSDKALGPLTRFNAYRSTTIKAGSVGSNMPATRSVRRDVILRVPKMNIATRRTSTTGHVADGEDKGAHRRSTSPSKRGIMHSEAESSKVAKSKSDGKEYKFAVQATSTAEWNSLLIWARRQRGPQWDAATGL